jgi:FkbM family methyltransferase
VQLDYERIYLPYGQFLTIAGESLNAQTKRDAFWDLELKPYLDRVKPGSHVIDVGAHVGYYSGYWAATGNLVTAVEGHPVYLPLLQENVDRNGWRPSINVLPFFAYHTTCFLEEVTEHETHASNTWRMSEGQSGRLALPLDISCAVWCQYWQRLDLIKVDAQGADLHVLVGAEWLIARYRPLILIEFEDRLASLHGDTADDYHRWAAEHHYREVSINGWNCLLEPQ